MFLTNTQTNNITGRVLPRSNLRQGPSIEIDTHMFTMIISSTRASQELMVKTHLYFNQAQNFVMSVIRYADYKARQINTFKSPPVTNYNYNKDHQRMMVDPMFMIVQSFRLFLTAVTPTAVATIAVILPEFT